MGPERVFRGAYAVMACGHGCGHRIETGPHDKAAWAWCILCQRPTCKRPWCMEHCPQVPRNRDHRYDRHRVADHVEDLICEALRISGIRELRNYTLKEPDALSD